MDKYIYIIQYIRTSLDSFDTSEAVHLFTFLYIKNSFLLLLSAIKFSTDNI